MTVDEAMEWVDQLNDHMDCGCYDTLTVLAAEVRRLMECCAIAGHDHAAYIFDTEARLAAARAEAARLKERWAQAKALLGPVSDPPAWANPLADKLAALEDS